jgi:hypothetical protein
MTPSQIPERFERIMGCSQADLLRWLPDALADATLDVDVHHMTCHARWNWGILKLCWEILEDRKIALLSIPRLKVFFEYAGASSEQRFHTQRKFDLHTQRGGG